MHGDIHSPAPVTQAQQQLRIPGRIIALDQTRLQARRAGHVVGMMSTPVILVVHSESKCGHNIGRRNTTNECSPAHYTRRLLVWYLDLAGVDSVDDIMRGLAVNCAANALRRAEDLLGAVSKVLRQRL